MRRLVSIVVCALIAVHISAAIFINVALRSLILIGSVIVLIIAAVYNISICIMNKVTQNNFKDLYPNIEKALRNASFIAIDAEFSGLQRSNQQDVSGESLFDSPKERYTKLRTNTEPFIAIQFGLTTFAREIHANKYSAETFDFHIMPRALPTRNRTFLSQAASIEFLSTYNFDFNQFAYNAISYMNEEEAAELARTLKNGIPLSSSGNFGFMTDEEEVEDCFKKIQTWLANTKCTDTHIRIEASSFRVRYLMEKELRHSFKGIWTESSNATQFSVIKVSADVRQSLENQKTLDNEFFDHHMGFAKIFNLMTILKKPIVGHNLLLDLMFMYKQFFRPLPETWTSNILPELYSYFKDGSGKFLALNSPVITLPGSPTDDNIREEKFHDAGWDSYCTGYCFIKMAHIYAVAKLSKNADMRIMTNTEIMSGVKERVNRLNLIRADLSYLQLDGPDPISTRPRWLCVKPLNKDFTTRQIAQAFSRFGLVDVKTSSGNNVLVAVPNHNAARNILKFCAENSEFRVAPYNPLRHSSTTIKAVVWIGSMVLSSAGVFAWMLHRNGLPSK